MINYHDLFYYDDGTVRWKVSLSNRIRIGEIAGTISKNGYVRVRVSGRFHSIHRVAWILNHGDIPEGLVVDHIDGDKKNNRIENLRVVTTKVNLFNAKKAKNNKSGVTGVCWDSRRKSWMVHFGKGNILGNFKSFEEACEVRKNAEKNSGICTERHGK